MDGRITKDMKYAVARELVSSYLRGEGGKNVRPEDLAKVFKTVYDSLDESFPEPEQRRVGLG